MEHLPSLMHAIYDAADQVTLVCNLLEFPEAHIKVLAHHFI